MMVRSDAAARSAASAPAAARATQRPYRRSAAQRRDELAPSKPFQLHLRHLARAVAPLNHFSTENTSYGDLGWFVAHHPQAGLGELPDGIRSRYITFLPGTPVVHGG